MPLCNTSYEPLLGKKFRVISNQYTAVISFFLKDFRWKSSPRSKLFEADNNKNLDRINGIQSRFLRKIIIYANQGVEKL